MHWTEEEKLHNLELEVQHLTDELNGLRIFRKDVLKAIGLNDSVTDAFTIARLDSLFKQWEQFYSPAA